MATKQSALDKDTKQGIILVVLLALGFTALGGIMVYLWQSDEKPKKAQDEVSRYLSMGEQVAVIGDNSMLVKFAIEYQDPETELALKQAMPGLKRLVTKRMSQMQPADLERLRTRQGKEEFAQEILEKVRDALPAEDADKVQDILYEKFLIGE